MANILPVFTDNGDGTATIFWEAIGNGDDGWTAGFSGQWQLESWQATGTADSSTITLNVSNDGTNFAAAPTAKAFTAAGVLDAVGSERFRYYRWILSSDGASTDWDITAFLTKKS